MSPTALSYMPALLLPLAVQVAPVPTVWLFIAAAAGFTLPPLVHFALAEHLARGTDTLFRDTYYVVSRAPVNATVALVFAALAVVQFLKVRLDREGSGITAVLFWVLLLAALGSRLIITVAFPAVTPTRYLDYPTALHPWVVLNEICFVVAAAALAFLVALVGLAPLWRRATERRAGGR